LYVEHETRFELAFPSRSSTSHTRCSLIALSSPSRWQGDAGGDSIELFRPKRSYRVVSVNRGGSWEAGNRVASPPLRQGRRRQLAKLSPVVHREIPHVPVSPFVGNVCHSDFGVGLQNCCVPRHSGSEALQLQRPESAGHFRAAAVAFESAGRPVLRPPPWFCFLDHARCIGGTQAALQLSACRVEASLAGTIHEAPPAAAMSAQARE
jgi:hypothetical protein